MKVFTNVFVTHTGIGLKNLRIIKNTVYENRHYSDFYKYAIYKYIFCKRVKFKSRETYLCIHNHWSRGYHHWLVESLVRALSIREMDRKNLTLLLPEKYHAFAFDSLRPFGFKDIVTIPHRKCVSVNNVIIPPNPDYQEFRSEDMLRLKAFYSRAYGIDGDRAAQRRIYVSRQNATMRRIANEEEVIRVMEKFNFEIIKAEHLSFEEQVRLFSETKYFVSIHGAALTNMIFMEEGAHVLEFFRAIEEGDPPKTFCFDKLGKAANIDFSTLYFPHDRGSTLHPDRADLTVNVNHLEVWLDNNIGDG